MIGELDVIIISNINSTRVFFIIIFLISSPYTPILQVDKAYISIKM